MRTLATPMVSLLLGTVALLALLPSPGSAQSVTVGGVVGVGGSKQLMDRASDSRSRTGFVAGAWTDVGTPVRFLHVLAEAVYARRGGRFLLEGSNGLVGDVESDRFAVTVAPTLHVGMRGVAAYLYGGPTLEVPVRTRTVAALGSAYATPSDQGLSVTAGAGVEVRRGRWSVRGEARIVEGLSPAYSGSAGDIRQRSREILIRVGKVRSMTSGTPD